MVARILDELEQNNVVRDMCINMRVNSNDIDDLIQEIYMVLLEYNRDKIIEMYERRQLRYFIVGIIQRQYRSNTSPFYKKYKKYYTLIDENNSNNGEVNDDVDDFE